MNVHDDGCAFRAIRLNVWCGDFHSSDGVPFHEINDTLTYFLLCVQFSCVLQSRFYSQFYTLRCTQLLPHPIRSFPCRVRVSKHSCYLKGVAKRSVNLNEIFSRETKFYLMPLYMKALLKEYLLSLKSMFSVFVYRRIRIK